MYAYARIATHVRMFEWTYSREHSEPELCNEDPRSAPMGASALRDERLLGSGLRGEGVASTSSSSKIPAPGDYITQTHKHMDTRMQVPHAFRRAN